MGRICSSPFGHHMIAPLTGGNDGICLSTIPGPRIGAKKATSATIRSSVQKTRKSTRNMRMLLHPKTITVFPPAPSTKWYERRFEREIPRDPRTRRRLTDPLSMSARSPRLGLQPTRPRQDERERRGSSREFWGERGRGRR